MKTNKIKHPGHTSALAVIAFILIAIVGIGIALGFEKLRDLWQEQSLVTDMEKQVSIESGKMVKAEVIAETFGLKAGANLATIDFGEKREATLKKIPNLRNLRIRRFLPDRVAITLEERTPLARVNIKGLKRESGKVVDSEGVVFFCSRGTQLLPVIREAHAPGTAPGHHLTERARAALRFIEACHDPELQELGILDVDVTPPDYLLATINTGSSYAQLKLAWEGMDEAPTPISRASLIRQLTHLRDAIRTRFGDGAVIWNATDFSSPGRIYADTKGNL